VTTRKRPARQNRPSRIARDAAQSNVHRRQDGYAAPDAEDRADTAVIAAAEELGYRIAVQCLDCGHWLTAPSSLVTHRGPRCRAKAAADVV